MACNSCETTFQSYQSVVTSIVKSGSNALLYVANQGRNIVHLRRILICSTLGGGSTTLFLRPPPAPISWTGPEYLEAGATVLYYTWNNIPVGRIVQAQAEYVEIEARSRSCPINF